MEFENINPQKEDTENNIDLRDIIDKYLIYWKWFVLAVIVSLFLAYLKLNFSRYSYESISTIQIKDEKGGGGANELSAFQDLGIMGGTKDNIEDEIEILKSKTIIGETIKSLKLNVSYQTEKNFISDFFDSNINSSTEFYGRERYLDPPLKINFLEGDSVLYKTGASFLISVKSNSKFTLTDLEDNSSKSHGFGEKIKTNFGDIIIIPIVDLKKEKLIGENILVNIVPLKSAIDSYQERLLIEPKSEFSTVVSLTITDTHKRRGEDFLNELVNKYNERAIYLKDELTKSTSDFVNRRLEIISEELNNVDLTAESIKTRYKMSDVASETGLNMQSGQAIESQIVQANMELQQIESVKDFVSTKSNNELIPVDVGVNDNSVANTMQQYNQLMLQKKRLLENSTEKNPIVVNLSEQLKTLKENINQGLTNLQSSQQISINALNQQDARINSRLYAAPKQERQIRDIQRQQQIKEQLFLYLLQKREETAITLGVADPNAKIIDAAESFKNAVAPKKKLTYLGAIILGLLIPFGIIFLLDFLDAKVHTREDVEKILDVPILGDIPKLDKKERFLIKKEDHSSIAEAFRILRTNLNFIIDSNIKGKTIFVTSTIAHEGKSLVSSNLATSLAHGGKKTLLLGMDIRAPKLEAYLDVRGNVGITNYIVNPEIKLDDLIVQPEGIDNLDVISSGDLAPNPSELLMNPRVKELFASVKEKYDYIIVDTAAFSMVTDTMLLSNLADAFIYVIRANYLDKRLLRYIKSIHKEKRLPNLSLLINGVDHKKSYGYGYGYGYGTNFEQSKKKPWRRIFSK